MARLIALLLSFMMTFGGTPSALIHDAVVQSKSELHLSDTELTFRKGDTIRLTVLPADAAQPLGWGVDDVVVSNPAALRVLDNKSPEAQAKREALQKKLQTSENPDDGQLVVYLYAISTGSAKIEVKLSNAYFPEEKVDLSLETTIAAATNPWTGNSSGTWHRPSGPSVKPVDPGPVDPDNPDDPGDLCPDHESHDTLHEGQTCQTCKQYTGKVKHAFGEWEIVIEPTTDAAGLKKHVCTCRYEETEDIPKLEDKPEKPEHDPVASAHDKSSFNEDGTCKTDGCTYTRTQFQQDCTDHAGLTTNDYCPTCGAPGTLCPSHSGHDTLHKEQQCPDCDVIGAADHAFENGHCTGCTATCNIHNCPDGDNHEPGKHCSVCGTDVPTEHNENSAHTKDDFNEDGTCTTDGCTYTLAQFQADCRTSHANLTTADHCPNCGIAGTLCTNHTKHASLHEGQECETCHAYTGTIAHTYSGGRCGCGATCTVDTCPSDERHVPGQYCSVCGATPPLKTFDPTPYQPNADALKFTYDGSAQGPSWDWSDLPDGITPSVVFVDEDGNPITFTDADGETVDYPTNAGTYTYKILFDVPDTYAAVGPVTGTYTIAPKPLSLKYETDETSGQVNVVLDGIVGDDVVNSTTIVSNDINWKAGDTYTGQTTVDVAKGDFSIVSTQVDLTDAGNYTIADADKTTIYQTVASESWFNIEMRLDKDKTKDDTVVVQFVLCEGAKTDQFQQTHVDDEEITFNKFALEMTLNYDSTVLRRTDYSPQSIIGADNPDWTISMATVGSTDDGGLDVAAEKVITASHDVGTYNSENDLTLCTVTFKILEGADANDILLSIDSVMKTAADKHDIDNSPDFEYQGTSSVILINHDKIDPEIKIVTVEGDLAGDLIYTGDPDDQEAKDAALKELEELTGLNLGAPKVDDGTEDPPSDNTPGDEEQPPEQGKQSGIAYGEIDDPFGDEEADPAPEQTVTPNATPADDTVTPATETPTDVSEPVVENLISIDNTLPAYVEAA